MPWIALDFNDDLIKVCALLGLCNLTSLSVILMYSMQIILSYAVLTLKVRSIPTLILIEPQTGKLACLIYSKFLLDVECKSVVHAKPIMRVKVKRFQVNSPQMVLN